MSRLESFHLIRIKLKSPQQHNSFCFHTGLLPSHRTSHIANSFPMKYLIPLFTVTWWKRYWPWHERYSKYLQPVTSKAPTDLNWPWPYAPNVDTAGLLWWHGRDWRDVPTRKECHQLLATQEARREAWTGSPLESSGSCPCDIGIPLFSKVCFIRAGALGRPRGMGWRGRREGESGWRTHVNPWLIHVNVWQKITTML